MRWRWVSASLLFGSLVLAEDAPEKDPAADESAEDAAVRESRFEEQVAVTAGQDKVASAPLGSTSSVIDPRTVIGTATSTTDVVVESAGVSENGQGGLFQVYSIRGVSRQRVTSVVADMRIAAERRAGVSVSFIDPLLLGPVEVLRGPATTQYGSGALGGVVQVVPAKFEAWSLDAGLGDNSNERFVAGGTGGSRWSVGFAARKADNSEAPDGTQLNTHFTNLSLTARGSWEAGPRRYSVMLIPTYGKDIGKSNTDYPEKTTNYPRERHLLLGLSVDAENGSDVHAFLHPQDLETEIVDSDSHTSSLNRSVDFGARWERQLDVRGTELEVGAQLFARRNVDATEVRQDTTTGAITSLEPLDNAEETELGAYATCGWDWGSSTWEVGGRLMGVAQRNRGFDRETSGGFSGFVGARVPLGSGLELLGNVSRGLRFPNLSERFFTGTTPRGGVIGNPLLDEEQSLNGELTLRWLGRSVLVTAAVFHNRIADYIERVEIAPDLLSWVNLTSGTIRGLELQGAVRAGGAWQLGWGGHAIAGESDDGMTLSDIPPAELFAEVVWRPGRWDVGGRLAHRWAKTEIGSGEKPIPEAELLSMAVSRRWVGGLRVSIEGRNLLDETYFRSADEKAPLAGGRTIFVGIGWSHPTF